MFDGVPGVAPVEEGGCAGCWKGVLVEPPAVTAVEGRFLCGGIDFGPKCFAEGLKVSVADGPDHRGVGGDAVGDVQKLDILRGEVVAPGGEVGRACAEGGVDAVGLEADVGAAVAEEEEVEVVGVFFKVLRFDLERINEGVFGGTKGLRAQIVIEEKERSEDEEGVSVP